VRGPNPKAAAAASEKAVSGRMVNCVSVMSQI
jgi:hypothetical protein